MHFYGGVPASANDSGICCASGVLACLVGGQQMLSDGCGGYGTIPQLCSSLGVLAVHSRADQEYNWNIKSQQWRVESTNGRVKNWRILRNEWHHHRPLGDHSRCFHIICALYNEDIVEHPLSKTEVELGDDTDCSDLED